MQDTNGHALIIGAGIGGLTLAIALQREGFQVSVFEKADELGDVGAGLTLAKNANLAYLHLGLNEAITSFSHIPNYGAIKDYNTGEELRRTKALRVPVSKTAGSTDENQIFSVRQVHRADMHNLLVNEVRRVDHQAIHLSHTFTSLDQDGATVTAHFDNGASATGDFLIGCDGIRSTVRQTLFGQDEPEFLNFVAWRGLVPTKRLPEGLIHPDTGMFEGKHKSFVRYKLRQGELVNYVAFARREEWTEDGWTVPSTVQEVMAEFADATEEITIIIENTPPEKCFKWGLLGREPLPEWTVGRATLLGDAAHPMLPFLGQGAGMAIEDAIILSRALVFSGDPSEGYRRYEAARVERARWVTLGSRHAALKINGVIEKETQAAAVYYDKVSEYDPVNTEV